MAHASQRPGKPAITITQSDLDGLMPLVANGASEDLLEEITRARVVPDGKLPAGVVRMGSSLRYRTDTGAARVVTLVYPKEADIAQGKVSVLTPIGAALIGLKAGQSIDWTARDGRVHRLTIEEVGDAAALAS